VVPWDDHLRGCYSDFCNKIRMVSGETLFWGTQPTKGKEKIRLLRFPKSPQQLTKRDLSLVCRQKYSQGSSLGTDASNLQNRRNGTHESNLCSFHTYGDQDDAIGSHDRRTPVQVYSCVNDQRSTWILRLCGGTSLLVVSEITFPHLSAAAKWEVPPSFKTI